MGIKERRAKQDTIDKYLRHYWGDYPHLSMSILPGKNLQERVNNFVGQIVDMAKQDWVGPSPGTCGQSGR